MHRAIERLSDHISGSRYIYGNLPTLDVAQSLLHSTFMGQRPNEDAFGGSVAYLQRLHLISECFRKLVVNIILDENPVGRDARLTRVAELSKDTRLYGGLELSIVEDYERTVSAQLKRQLGQVVGTLSCQYFANASGSGEAEFANRFRFTEGFTHFCDLVKSKNHVDRAFRKSSLLG
jgi:hypothetical protein